MLPLPALKDNYIWLVHDGSRAWVVDPGDAKPVRAALEKHQLELAGILVTHHHADHTAGIATLLEDANHHNLTPLPVYGPAHETIAAVSHPVQGGDTISLLGMQFLVLDIPGHTAGHIAFYAPTAQPHLSGDMALQQPWLFCGDTLFSAGCGRLFEGTPEQMKASLDQLAALPDSTLVCCTHEYTVANVKFALAVEPNNTQLLIYQHLCAQKRQAGLPTLPSTIAQECAINPFLRAHVPAVAAAAQQFDASISTQDAGAVWAALRRWKNEFA